MKAQRVWVCLGGGLCLTAAMVVQRVWGQGPPPGLPGLPPTPSPPAVVNAPLPPPPSTAPSKQMGSDVPQNAPLPQLLQAPPNSTPSVGPLAPPSAPQILENRATDIPLPPGNSASYRPADLAAGETRHNKQEPTVSVEWVGAINARFNQPTSYQILVRNSGSSPVNHVAVKPNLPDGAIIKSSDPILPQGVDACWTVGTLAAGQFRKIDVTIVSQKRGPQNYSATVFFAASASHVTEVREPLLQIKTKVPDKGLVGEPFPIQFTISNPGDGATENVKVRAILPEGLEHPRGQSFEIDAGNLNPKETRTLQLSCLAKGQGPMKASVVASADGNLNVTDVASFELVLPRLDLVLNGPKLRFVDRPARYTMTVTNPGIAPAQAVVVNEILPAGFRFNGASHQGKFDEASRTVSWQLGDLPAGQAREMTVDLIPTMPGDHRLAAAAQSARGIRSESEIQTRVEGLSSLVLEVVNADNPVEVGADATYQIRLANAGTKIETNVELICTLPAGVEFRDAKCAAGSRFRMEKNDVTFEPLPRLAPRGEVIYRVTVKGRVPGDVRFRAVVRAEGMADALIREETTKFYDDNVGR